MSFFDSLFFPFFFFSGILHLVVPCLCVMKEVNSGPVRKNIKPEKETSPFIIDFLTFTPSCLSV